MELILYAPASSLSQVKVSDHCGLDEAVNLTLKDFTRSAIYSGSSRTEVLPS